jgi:NitT/TauT family transport system ATP-binding protein
MSVLLQLERVDKRYDNGTLALQDVNLTVGEREFVSFLGPSGCGKSTALKMIAGLLEVTSGQIKWADNSADHAKDISFVFQEPTLMPWAKVFDNVWLPLRLKGIAREAARPKVEAVLAKVGLSQFANVYPRELSGGMKMRVSIARAMVTQPRLLLMDEPFAALDEMTRFKLNNDTLALWTAQQFTTIFVTQRV